MKLANDQQVVNALKRILEDKDYYYLKYDETWDDDNQLRVIVTIPDAERNERVPIGVRNKLADATNRKFSSFHCATDDPMNKEWIEFILEEANGNQV